MKTYIGLNISDVTIEASELSVSMNNLRVLSYSRIKLKEGIVKDGLVMDEKIFMIYLKKLLKSAKPKSFRTKQIVLSIPDSKVYTHYFKVPKELKGSDLDAYIKKEIEGILPFDLYEILWTYNIISQGKKENEIFWIGSEKSIVNSYIVALKKLGYQVVCVEPESEALFRLYFDNIKENKAVCLIDLGAQVVNISIFDQRGLVVTESIKGAGEDWTKKIAQTQNISLSKAEKIKKAVGLDTESKYTNIVLVLLKELEKVVKGVKKVTAFYERKQKQQISNIVITGGGSRLKKISSFLKDNFEVNVTVGKPVLNMTGEKVSVGVYAVSMGLSLLASKKFHTRCTNLMPSATVVAVREKKVKRKNRFKKIALYSAISLALISAVVGAIYYRQVQAEKRTAELLNTPELIEYEINNYNLNFPVFVDVSQTENLPTASESMSVEPASDLEQEGYRILGRVMSGAIESSDVFGVTGRKTIANQEISILVDRDLERAKESLQTKVEYDYLLQALQSIDNINEETVVGNAVEIKVLNAYANHNVGAIVNSFSYTVKAEVTALIINNNDLVELAKDNLSLLLPETDEVENFNLSEFNILIKNYDEENQVVEILVQSSASRIQ